MYIPYPSKPKKGFGLIEILLVIGIIAILALAAFITYTVVRPQQIAGQEVRAMLGAAAQIKSFQAMMGGRCQPLGQADMVKLKIFPDREITNGNFSSPAAGSLIVSDYCDGNGTTFVFRQIPKEMCQPLANASVGKLKLRVQNNIASGPTDPIILNYCKGGVYPPAVALTLYVPGN